MKFAEALVNSGQARVMYVRKWSEQGGKFPAKRRLASQILFLPNIGERTGARNAIRQGNAGIMTQEPAVELTNERYLEAHF